MEKFISIIAILLLVPLAPVTLTGCRGGPERVVFKTTSVTAATVDRAIASWNSYIRVQRERGTPVSLEQEIRVKQAWEQYQLALKAVTDAGAAYSRSRISDPDGATSALAVLDSASQVLGASMASIVDLIASFGITVY